MNQRAKRQTGFKGTDFFSMAVESKRIYFILFTVALAWAQILQTEHTVGLHVSCSAMGLQILQSWDLDLAATLGDRPPPNPI